MLQRHAQEHLVERVAGKVVIKELAKKTAAELARAKLTNPFRRCGKLGHGQMHTTLTAH